MMSQLNTLAGIQLSSIVPAARQTSQLHTRVSDDQNKCVKGPLIVIFYFLREGSSSKM